MWLLLRLCWVAVSEFSMLMLRNSIKGVNVLSQCQLISAVFPVAMLIMEMQ